MSLRLRHYQPLFPVAGKDTYDEEDNYTNKADEDRNIYHFNLFLFFRFVINFEGA
jgi:hypothetical protein